jgi:hypothetical protein
MVYYIGPTHLIVFANKLWRPMRKGRRALFHKSTPVIHNV